MPLAIELTNGSGAAVDAEAARTLAAEVLAAEGIRDGELGIAYVRREEIRRLKREQLGIDQVTDVLSFPIDRRDDLPPGVPRQLGDVVVCPQVVGEEWQVPLVHAVLHLVGYEHGDEMREREALHR